MSLYRRHINSALSHYQELTGEEYTYEEMRLPNGSRALSKARYFVICYLHTMPERFSLPQIQRMLNFGNHTSVLYALRRGHGHDGALVDRYTPYWTKRLFQDLIDPFLGHPAKVYRHNIADIATIGARNIVAMREAAA